MAAVEITVDTREIDRVLSALRRPRLDKPVALALADTQKNTKVKATSLIAKHMGVRSGAVKEKIITPFVAIGQYVALVKSSRKPIPLIDFPTTKQNSRGVYTRAWGKPQTIRGGFVATMPTGHRGAFLRVNRGRLPIKQLWGPTISGTFATKDVADLVRQTMRARLQVNLVRRMKAEMRKRAP